MQNQVIAYYGYARAKMNVNGAPTISGHLSLVNENRFSCGYT